MLNNPTDLCDSEDCIRQAQFTKVVAFKHDGPVAPGEEPDFGYQRSCRSCIMDDLLTFQGIDHHEIFSTMEHPDGWRILLTARDNAVMFISDYGVNPLAGALAGLMRQIITPKMVIMGKMDPSDLPGLLESL